MLEQFKGLQDRRDDFQGSLCASDSQVMLMDVIEVAFSFFSQYYARHVLPT